MKTKYGFLVFIFLGVVAPTSLSAQSATRYVRDVLYIELRVTQDSGSKVVKSGLTSGTPLTVIEESADGKYSLLETSDGEQGWTQTQYLSDQPAARDLLDAANARIASLDEKRKEQAERLAALNARFTETSTSLNELTRIESEQQQELDRMTKLSSNAVVLDRENTQLKSDNLRLENQLATVANENAQLRTSMNNDRFLHGAIAVLIGVVITLIVPRLWPSKKNEWR